MSIRAGFTRFRGEAICTFDADILRSMQRRLRGQIKGNRVEAAQDTYRRMVDYSSSNPRLRRIVSAILNEVVRNATAKQVAEQPKEAVDWAREGF